MRETEQLKKIRSELAIQLATVSMSIEDGHFKREMAAAADILGSDIRMTPALVEWLTDIRNKFQAEIDVRRWAESK